MFDTNSKAHVITKKKMSKYAKTINELMTRVSLLLTRGKRVNKCNRSAYITSERLQKHGLSNRWTKKFISKDIGYGHIVILVMCRGMGVMSS